MTFLNSRYQGYNTLFRKQQQNLSSADTYAHFETSEQNGNQYEFRIFIFAIYKPRIDEEILNRTKAGIFVTNHLLKADPEKIRLNAFSEFYIYLISENGNCHLFFNYNAL